MCGWSDWSSAPRASVAVRLRIARIGPELMYGFEDYSRAEYGCTAETRTTGTFTRRRGVRHVRNRRAQSHYALAFHWNRRWREENAGDGAKAGDHMARRNRPQHVNGANITAEILENGTHQSKRI